LRKTPTGLIDGLRDRVDEMSNNQRVILARFYADGIGVAQDRAFAQELIREAAYGGNANALLEIARLAQSGTLIEQWDAPLDLTVTMAFGGILGALDGGVCRRAERIAQAYATGDVVTANPALALAWFKFAADMGRAQSAWRVVEFHLNADAAQKDNTELRRYLRQAVRRGAPVSEGQRDALVNSGAVNKQELEEILGFNHSQDNGRTNRSIVPFLQLQVNIPEIEPDGGTLYLRYLREIAEIADAPGRVFDRLGVETLISKGRWAAEDEAKELFEEAARRGDGPGTRRLARQAYAATKHRTVAITAEDLLALSPSRAPEGIAHIQTLALTGRSQMVASQAQRVQDNPLAARAALQYWAAEVNRSKQPLEDFAELQFELAQTPVHRDQAVEFFRRVYLHNGVTSALDLAIALVEYNARDPQVAKEIETLLTIASNRGEGGAIRLLSRLTTGAHSDPALYARYADVIEDRGDFLALMFALPHVAQDKVDDYIDRAVSLMNCGTKDADEIGDAYAMRQMGELSYHWRTIGLHFDGGHVLSKLRLSNRQMRWFNDGAAPDPAQAASRAFEEGDNGALMQLLALTANADLETYDPAAATGYFLDAIQRTKGSGMADVVAMLRAAPDEVRDGVAQSTDITAALQGAAQAGDVASAYALGMVLRDAAKTPEDLSVSAKWLQEAAARGNRDAMFEYGSVLGYGLGRPVDVEQALNWLQQAASAGHPQAAVRRLIQSARRKRRRRWPRWMPLSVI